MGKKMARQDALAQRVMDDMRTRKPSAHPDAAILDAWQRMIDISAVWEGTSDAISNFCCDVHSHAIDVIIRTPAMTAEGRLRKLRVIFGDMFDEGDNTVWDLLFAGRLPDRDVVPLDTATEKRPGVNLWYLLKQAEDDARITRIAAPTLRDGAEALHLAAGRHASGEAATGSEHQVAA